MQIHVSSELNQVLERALAMSVNQGQFYVGVEHVFSAVLDDPDPLPPRVREKHLNRLYAVMREVNRTAWRGAHQGGTGEILHTPRCIAATQQASKLAERRGHRPAGAGHLLLAMLADGQSAPSRVMDQMGPERGEIIAALQAELGGVAATAATAPPRAEAPANGPAAARQLVAPQAAAAPASTPTGLLDSAEEAGAAPAVAPAAAPEAEAQGELESLTRDLSEAARAGSLDTTVGRDDETFEILQILTRKTKNNIMLVGEAGVGKTQIIEGLALRIAKEGGKPDGLMPDFRILELNLAAVMSGTQYRGAFEEKMLALLEELKASPKTVLFIDEAHLIMGAGSTDGDSMDMANLLKPALARGEIRCIGATTLQEYRKFVEKDPAIERRFQMLRVEELSEEASLEVLRRLRPSFEKHHRVRISSRAIRAAVALTQRYMPNRNLPDKAIDVLDHACARYRLKLVAAREKPERLENTIVPTAENKVTPHDIRKVVSHITAIPIEDMTAEERIHLSDLDRRIRRQLIGQDEAVGIAVSAVKKSRAGLADPNRPDSVMLFLGPSGVGKTQLAKLLTTHLFGSTNHLITFDMSEYIEEHSVSRLLGAPPGYVGHDEEGRLTGAVRTSPFSILIFDEIEKAHPRIFDIFLPVFDEGRLRDSRGREVSFKNCIIILTSNVGADLLIRSEGESDKRALVDELQNHFRPEFINRIDEIVPFYPLLNEDVRSILRLEVESVRKRLKEKRIGIRMYQGAYEHLAEVGYSHEFGARELRRAVDRYVTTPISKKIIDGSFEKGDMIDVLIEDGALAFQKGRPHSTERKA